MSVLSKAAAVPDGERFREEKRRAVRCGAVRQGKVCVAVPPPSFRSRPCRNTRLCRNQKFLVEAARTRLANATRLIVVCLRSRRCTCTCTCTCTCSCSCQCYLRRRCVSFFVTQQFWCFAQKEVRPYEFLALNYRAPSPACLLSLCVRVCVCVIRVVRAADRRRRIGGDVRGRLREGVWVCFC